MKELASAFDLVAWGSTTNYNSLSVKLAKDGKLNFLPEDSLMIALGNSSKIWPEILKYQQENKSKNPFDDFTKAVSKDIKHMFPECDCRFAFDIFPEKVISLSNVV